MDISPDNRPRKSLRIATIDQVSWIWIETVRHAKSEKTEPRDVKRFDMVHHARRAGLAAVALVGALMLGASPASATVTPTPTPTPTPTGFACLDGEDSYGARGVCQLTVKADTVCIGDLPYLEYTLEALGTPNTTASAVWGDPNGTHHTMTDLPLSGRVLWPGAVEGPNGEALDWPGWTLAPDGYTWVEHDEWDWVRGGVPVTFQVNPSAQIIAVYPEATAPCADPPTTVVSAADEPGDPQTAVLSATGSESLRVALAAGGLLIAGGLILFVRSSLRRRAAH